MVGSTGRQYTHDLDILIVEPTNKHFSLKQWHAMTHLNTAPKYDQHAEFHSSGACSLPYVPEADHPIDWESVLAMADAIIERDALESSDT